jgi:hypothetical protein
MPILTIRLSDTIANEVNAKSKLLRISKNAYIQKAIDILNSEINTNLKKKQLENASRKVASNSIEVNMEFSAIEDDSKI